MDNKYIVVDETFQAIEIPPIDQLCKIIKHKFQGQEDRINYLENENKALKDEHFKDETIAALTAEIEDLERRDGFMIYPDESEKINEWLKDHNHYSGAVGGNITYSFTPTSIGIIGTVKCSCGKSLCFRELE